MGFAPCNHILKIRESIWDFNSHNGSSLGRVKVHSLTLFTLPKACDVTPGSAFWPTTLQPLALVASPRLGLRQQVLYEVKYVGHYPFIIIFALLLVSISFRENLFFAYVIVLSNII
jgi:hypothetical protein